jgi:ketol-acid reductoisomerase
LKELRDSEMWQAGKTVRSLRPENQPGNENPFEESSTKSVFREQALKSESVG